MNNASVALPVVERFVSINGEGLRAGRLAAFIRMAGCNLACSWCDTAWANEDSCPHETLSVDALVQWVTSTGVSCITLTGGEPALQPGLPQLIAALALSERWGGEDPRVIEIETNGSVDLAELHALRQKLAETAPKQTTLAFTVDCKMPSSGMAAEMLPENYALLGKADAVKFVVAGKEDLQSALACIRTYDLDKTCGVLLSPVFSCIEPADIVAFMMEHELTMPRIQLQLHKIIWSHTEKGV